MDYHKVRSELVTAIRGNISRFQLNKEMGNTYDKVSVWEKPEGRMAWDDFIALCRHYKLPVKEAFQKTLLFSGDIEDGKSFFLFLCKDMSPEEIAYICELPVARIRRLHNNFAPTLDEIIQMIHHLFNFRILYNLIKELISQELPTFALDVKRSRQFIELVLSDERYELITILMRHQLNKDGVEQSISLVSNFLEVDRDTSKIMLDKLCSVGVLKLANGQYIPDEDFTNFGKNSAERQEMVIRMLNRFAKAYGGEDAEGNAASCVYGTEVLSENALLLVKEEIARSMRRVVQIVKEDRGAKTRPSTIVFGVYDPTLSAREKRN